MHKLCVVAASVGVTESAVSRWRCGAPMTLDNVERVCLALDISADWFVLGRGSMNMHLAQDYASCPHIVHAVSRLPPRLRDQLRHFLEAVAELT